MKKFSRQREHPSHRRQRGGRFASSKSALEMILLFPFRVLLSPFTAILKRMRDRKLDGHRSRRNFRQKLPSFGKQISRLPGDLLAFPATILKYLRCRKRSELVLVGSVLLVLLTVGLAILQFYIRPSYLAGRYQRDALNAVAAGEFELANIHFKRLAVAKKLTNAEKFEQVRALQQTEQFDQVDAILDELAPDDGPIGFPAAHQMKAIRIAKNLSQGNDAQILKKLRRHLESSQSSSPELDQAWAIFHLLLDQPDQALSVLKHFAGSNPENYLLMAQIYAGQGREPQQVAVLNEAKDVFISAVEKNPLNQQSRILAANVYVQLTQYDPAEHLLKEGLRLTPDSFMRRALASFYVMLSGVESPSLLQGKQSLDALDKALTADPDYPPIYQRLLEISAGDDQATTIIREMVEKQVREKPIALAHFTLSNLLEREGDGKLAQHHLEQAYRLDNKNFVILNNLAWSLAHEDVPNLERALELSATTVVGDPANTGFHDTYGTILLKLGRYQEATTELQLAMSPSSENHLIHRKLAAAYEHLNMSVMAEAHSKKAIPADLVVETSAAAAN